MPRILSLAAAAAVVIGCAATAMAQQPSYSDRTSTQSDRYSTSDRYPTRSDRSSTQSDRYPTSDRYSTYPNRDRTYHDRYATQRAMPDRGNMMRGRFASEADARANCRGDSVVWANTKTHVYHLPGTPRFGHTKHGAFMCQADADRSGSFRAAKDEKPMRGYSGSSMPR